jgi:putative RNA 2'-phosphotransferase
MNKRLTKISKYLTFVLRHEPQSIGMKLDPDGWLDIDELIKNANASGKSITKEQLHQVVAENDAQRYELSEDSLRIRATPAIGPTE